MINLQIRKLDKYQREAAFMADNAADFPKNSPGDTTAKEFAAVIARIQTLAAAQTSRQVNQKLEEKDEALARMIKLCYQINRAANTLGEEIEGIEEAFRLPRKRSEAIWLATARAFHRDSAANEADLQDYIKANPFRDALNALINEVEQAATAHDTAGEQKGGATGGLVDEFQKAGKLSRRLNVIVLNEYDDDAQKLAAWMIASHLEAAPKGEPKAKPKSGEDDKS